MILDFHDMITCFLVHVSWVFISIQILLRRHSASCSPDWIITPCNVVIRNSSTAKDCLVLQQTSILVGISESRISKFVCNLLVFFTLTSFCHLPVPGTVFSITRVTLFSSCPSLEVTMFLHVVAVLSALQLFTISLLIYLCKVFSFRSGIIPWNNRPNSHPSSKYQVTHVYIIFLKKYS